MPHLMKWIFGFAALSLSVGASAESVNAGREWSDSWGFKGSDWLAARTAQAEAIERADNDYWKSPTYTVTTNTTNTTNIDAGYYIAGGTGGQYNVTGGNAVADISTGDVGGMTSTTFGAYNSSSTGVNIAGNGNGVTISNGASSTGCQNGSINLSGRIPSIAAGSVMSTASANASSAVTSGC